MTGIYDYLDRDFALPRQERIEWKGADGTTVEGILTYPIDYKPGTRYPLVVQLHGGPEDSDKFGAGHDLPELPAGVGGEGLCHPAAQLSRAAPVTEMLLPRAGWRLLQEQPSATCWRASTA